MQYTWSVPQDLAALASLMGGDAAATGKLETFMSSLNATRNAPYDWSGNEPSEWAPWEFDYFGAPGRRPAVGAVHRRHRVRRRTGRRAGQRRPRRHLLVVRVGGPGAVPRDPGLGQPGPRQPPVPLCDDHPARRPPPRRGRPGGGGLPALRARPERHRRDATRAPSRRRPAAPVRLCPTPPPGRGTCPGCRRRSFGRGAPCTTPSRARPTRPGGRRRRDSPPSFGYRSAARRRVLVARAARRPSWWVNPRPSRSG